MANTLLQARNIKTLVASSCYFFPSSVIISLCFHGHAHNTGDVTAMFIIFCQTSAQQFTLTTEKQADYGSDDSRFDSWLARCVCEFLSESNKVSIKAIETLAQGGGERSHEAIQPLIVRKRTGFVVDSDVKLTDVLTK